MWREFKLLNIMLVTGVLDLQEFLDNFETISFRLRVESRKEGGCRMQLANASLS